MLIQVPASGTLAPVLDAFVAEHIPGEGFPREYISAVALIAQGFHHTVRRPFRIAEVGPFAHLRQLVRNLLRAVSEQHHVKRQNVTYENYRNRYQCYEICRHSLSGNLIWEKGNHCSFVFLKKDKRTVPLSF